MASRSFLDFLQKNRSDTKYRLNELELNSKNNSDNIKIKLAIAKNISSKMSV